MNHGSGQRAQGRRGCAPPARRTMGLISILRERDPKPAVNVEKYHRQVRGGKTPCIAMQKFSVRYGCKLLCGEPPPVMARQFGLRATLAGVP